MPPRPCASCTPRPCHSPVVSYIPNLFLIVPVGILMGLLLALPVRPGDVIHVPEPGRVFVQGWVETPGAVAMTRGLTVLSAVTAAGGTRYPAAPHAVHVLPPPPLSGTKLPH